MQDHGGADKLSLCSGRSLRSSERSYRDEVDSMSLSSGHRRTTVLGQRMGAKLANRNVSMGSTAELGEALPEEELQSVVVVEGAAKVSEEAQQTLSHVVESPQTVSTTSRTTTTMTTAEPTPNRAEEAVRGSPSPSASKSKTAILRNIFFSQTTTSPSSSPT